MRLLLLAALMLSTVSHAAISPTLEPTWLYGVWKLTHDEDGSPADVMAFSGDKNINYGFNCAVRHEYPFHIYGGDVYVTVTIEGKGPISIIFRPSADKSKLTFTSPRTRNNATYEKLAENPCE